MQTQMKAFKQAAPAPAAHVRASAAGPRSVRARAASTAEPHVPKRNFLDDASEEEFRFGRPDYTVVNTEYLKNKSRNWQPGSLEDVVESVVKTFEFEISHKKTADLVKSFAPGFKYSQNGGPKIDGRELLRRGSYNVLITDEAYTANNWDFEESHDVFKTTFPKGFAWEVLEVFNGPPNVTFRWRHWGEMAGPYAGYAATGKPVELFGMAVARVNDKLQIEELEIYYDPTDFLTNLQSGGKCPLGFGSSGKTAAAPAAAAPAAAAATAAPESSGGLFGGVMKFLGFQ